MFYHCFLIENDCGLWDSLLERLNDAYKKNNNVILSNEELVNLPINNFTIPLWRNLLYRWDIQILIFYRPFHQWTYSMYVQHRKSLMYRSGGDLWIEHFGRQIEVKNFPEWLEDHIMSNSVDLRDTMAVKVFFEELYGINRVHVLDMITPHGLETEFFGNNVVNAVKALKVFKKIGEVPKENPASLLVLERMDTDLIIVQGHRQHLGNLGRHKGMRNTSRIKLEAKLIEWNMTTADLPRVCVSKEQEDWLWNKTLHIQKMFSHYPLSEEELQNQFDVDRKKWCGVDARTILNNSTWKDYLSSCEFTKIGCNTDEHNTSDSTV